jgi:hypothetical protein
MLGDRAEGDVGAHRRGAGNDDPGPPASVALAPATDMPHQILLAIRASTGGPGGQQQNVKLLLREP